MKTISIIISLMMSCAAVNAQQNNNDQTLSPHRYEIPCDNKTEFIVAFNEPHYNIEVILMKDGFIVDYVIQKTVHAGDEITVSSLRDNGNEEYVLIIKENGTIIYNEKINK